MLKEGSCHDDNSLKTAGIAASLSGNVARCAGRPIVKNGTFVKVHWPDSALHTTADKNSQFLLLADLIGMDFGGGNRSFSPILKHADDRLQPCASGFSPLRKELT